MRTKLKLQKIEVGDFVLVNLKRTRFLRRHSHLNFREKGKVISREERGFRISLTKDNLVTPEFSMDRLIVYKTKNKVREM